MRSRLVDRFEYIVRLTKQLVGERTLECIIKENWTVGNPEIMRLRSYVVAVIANKIGKMNNETLGGICAYASPNGIHDGKHLPGTTRPRFINRTGLSKVIPPDMKVWLESLVGARAPLEQMAMSVIVCVFIDLLFQDQWQAEWDSQQMTEEDHRDLGFCSDGRRFHD
jgi:hypothetical protein